MTQNARVETLLQQGHDQLEREQYQEAIVSFDKVIEVKADNLQAWYNRGVALFQLGRYQEALDSYDKALEIQPDYHYAWYCRGNALYNLERCEEAIASYNKALEIRPELWKWQKKLKTPV